MAERHIPMTMEDWAKRIDIILEASGDAILNDAGKITAEFAIDTRGIIVTFNFAFADKI